MQQESIDMILSLEPSTSIGDSSGYDSGASVVDTRKLELAFQRLGQKMTAQIKYGKSKIRSRGF